MPTVKEFVTKAYRLISASSPSVPLHGNDLKDAVDTLNILMSHYSANGLEITIAKTETVPIIANQQTVVIGGAGVVPTPDITAGRLGNLQRAWLSLNGVDYPLINLPNPNFLASYKYEPLSGLPVYVVMFPETEVTTLRLYPAPSQSYDFYVRGKFAISNLAPTDDLSSLPAYYLNYLYYALAREQAPFKGRAKAWTPELEAMYKEKKADMDAASEFDVSIVSEGEPMLNGANLVRAGV